MKRETIIAISFGILLGAVAGGVVLFKTNANDQAKVIPVATDGKKVVTQAPDSGSTRAQLVISEPVGNTVASSKTIKIVGRAPVGSLIIAQSPTAEKVLKNEKNEFSMELPLAVGENVINVSMYVGGGVPQEQILRVYYVPSE